MTGVHIIVLLLTGTFAGFSSGLLGVGGGFLMTPVQFWVFSDIGLSADAAIRLAFGTNLLVILPTAISGVWRHQHRGLVLWQPAMIMGAASAAVAYGGATLAAHLPGTTLKVFFGILVITGGLRMLFLAHRALDAPPRKSPWLWLAWSVPIGALSGLLGIGGGILAIPVMVLGLRFRIHNAVATSLGMMVFTSLGGLTGYIVNGRDISGLPPYSVGYVNLPAWLFLAAGSIGMAQVGALVAQRLPAGNLRYFFVALLFLVGLKMLGVFDWPGGPF